MLLVFFNKTRRHGEVRSNPKAQRLQVDCFVPRNDAQNQLL